jgi:hypothetical protein
MQIYKKPYKNKIITHYPRIPIFKQTFVLQLPEIAQPRAEKSPQTK